MFLNVGVVPRAERDDNHNQLGADLGKYLVVEPGDLVFNKLRTWQGGFGAAKHRGIVSPAYYVLKPSHLVDSRFVDYLLHSAPFMAELTRLSKWMPPSQFDMAWEDLKVLPVPLPPLDVQWRIADFLDEQVARVDQAMSIRQRQRKSLREWVAASASTLVDSLGDREWTRLSRFWNALEQGGSPVGTGSEASGSEPGVIKTSCVKSGRFIPQENKALSDPAEYEPRYRLRPGDLLIVRGSGSGDLVADCAVATDAVADKHLMLSDLMYRPWGLRLNPHFACAFLLTPQARSQIRALVRQGSGPAKVRGEDIGSVLVPVVPSAEQDSFGNRYWQLRASADDLDLHLGQSINLLEERKRSLITAAVTGEFDSSTASSRAAEVAMSGVGGAS